MNTKLFVIPILIAGCSTAPHVSPLPVTHPANLHAVEAPVNTFTIKNDIQEGTEPQDSGQAKPDHHTHSMQMDHKASAEMNSQHEGINQ